MRVIARRLALVGLFSLSTAVVDAQGLGQASVSGIVRDNQGLGLPGVTVTVSGEKSPSNIVVSGNSGEFRVADLHPGAYSLEASLDGFKPVSKRVKLVTGESIQVAFSLVPAFGETVNVVAEATRTGEVSVLETRRQAPVVSDSISAEEIRKTPDSSAAGVVERLTGVTLLGNKYVFVRGLGERYSATTINGSTVPTTETEKRVVPLDLFPAKLLESVNVVKTYTPDKPGDFGSGIVEMMTTQFPPSRTLRLTIGTGYLTNATGSSFGRYAGGLSRFGTGGQELPANFPKQYIRRSSILSPDGFTPGELESLGKSLIGPWTGETRDAPPNSEYALMYGSTFGRLGVVFSAVSNHGFDTINEMQRFFSLAAGNELVAYNDYDLVTDREEATNGLVGNLSFRLNDQNRLYLNSVLTRDALSEDRFQEGLQTNSGGNIRDFRVRYQLEQVLSNRLRGEHNLSGPGLGSLIEWNAARSKAKNDSNLRENIYRETDPGVFVMQTGFADSGKLEYFNLTDHINQAGAAYSLFLAAGTSMSGSLKLGADWQKRTRDFGARRFRFVPVSLQFIDLTRTPDEIYTAANIGPSRFELRENTGVNDAYDADHTVDAAYAMEDLTFGKWRLIGGARYEKSRQRVFTFNPFEVANAVQAVHDNNDVLPSLNLVYQLGGRTNLRLAYGRSLNRPEFRELSPFAFTEVAGGRSVAGNPDLVQATIDGFDFRWETFATGGEVVAASAFYKRIENPIERIVQPTTDYRISFVNAAAATLYGVELELRRSLASFVPALRLWSVNANFAHIKSNVDVGAHQFSVVTNTRRPLAGQSDNTANLALQFYHPGWGTMFRVLGAYSGKRLTEVGSFGLPDAYEAANTTVDAVITQSLSHSLDLKFAATNLTDRTNKFVQAGEIQRLFDPGRKFSLSLSYTPF
jgi:outer membrane receptor for ferrienterochelin and colicin